jgi:hypothetical protein
MSSNISFINLMGKIRKTVQCVATGECKGLKGLPVQTVCAKLNPHGLTCAITWATEFKVVSKLLNI